MIKVIIETKDKVISRITIKGHAYSDDPGHDLVCAGVSASAIGVLNTLEKFGFFEKECGSVEMKAGYIDIIVKCSDDVIQVVLETLVTTLDTIMEDNKKYIKISKVEV